MERTVEFREKNIGLRLSIMDELSTRTTYEFSVYDVQQQFDE